MDEFYRTLTLTVSSHCRIIKEEIIRHFPATSGYPSKDINVKYKNAVANLPDNRSYLIVMRDRLIWINQHESILRHSSFPDVKKEIYSTMIRNLYELIVAIFEAYEHKPALEKLLQSSMVLYREYHELCWNNLDEIEPLRDISKFDIIGRREIDNEFGDEMTKALDYLLSESESSPWVTVGKKSLPRQSARRRLKF